MNRVKKIFVLPFMILSFLTLSLKIYAVDESWFEYKVYDDGVVITSALVKKIEQIPDYLDNKKVVRLAERAFFACVNDAQKITIPDSVIEIESECFLGLIGNGYNTYYIPSGIKYIGNKALGYTTSYPNYYGNGDLDTYEEIVKLSDVSIYGYKNTIAETYAKENGFTFIALDEPEVTTTTAVTTCITTTTETTVSTTATTPKETTVSTTENTTTPTVTTSVTTDITTTETTANTYESTVSDTTTEKTSASAETTSITTSITTTTIEQIKVLGDANSDKKLDVRDCAFIASMLAQRKAEELPDVADFNGDGKVDVRDAAAIAKYLAGIH